MNSLEIRRVVDGGDLKRLRQFVLNQPQFYPNHGDWLDGKCLPRIESGRAVAWMAIVDGKVSGSAIYQSLDEPDTLELKNLRIDPEYRNRAIGYCLLRQVEVEGRDMISSQAERLTIVADVSAPNFSGVEFFVRNDFHIVGMDELYMPGQSEYLLQKLSRQPASMPGNIQLTVNGL